MMPGTMGMVTPACADAIEIAEVDFVIEEELGDGAGGAGVDLGLEHVDIGLDARRLRMLLRIASDGDLERRDRLEALDQIGGIDIAAWCRLISIADPARRIAAQRHDMAHAEIPIVADDLVDLSASRRRR